MLAMNGHGDGSTALYNRCDRIWQSSTSQFPRSAPCRFQTETGWIGDFLTPSWEAARGSRAQTDLADELAIATVGKAGTCRQLNLPTAPLVRNAEQRAPQG